MHCIFFTVYLNDEVKSLHKCVGVCVCVWVRIVQRRILMQLFFQNVYLYILIETIIFLPVLFNC